MSYSAAPSTRDVAPFSSLARAAWIPYAVTWDGKTDKFHGVEGPRWFASYREAVEASRFLMATPRPLDSVSLQR